MDFFVIYEHSQKGIQTEDTNDIWKTVNELMLVSKDIKVFLKKSGGYSEKPVFHAERLNETPVFLKNKRNVFKVHFNHIKKIENFPENDVYDAYKEKNVVPVKDLTKYAVIGAFVSGVIFAFDASIAFVSFFAGAGVFLFLMMKEINNLKDRMYHYGNFYNCQLEFTQCKNSLYTEYLNSNALSIKGNAFYCEKSLHVMNQEHHIIVPVGVDVYSDYPYYMLAVKKDTESK